jgi:putative ABC transport system ATP-binding protein
MSEGEYLLTAHEVVKTFGEGVLQTSVLRGVSFSLAPGELTLLMGPSGSGKTTFVSILAGVMRPSSGEVSLCGTPISKASDEQIAQIRRKHVGFVFQTPNLFPALTAHDNVYDVLRLKGYPREEARSKAMEALQRVGLEQRINHRPAQLSGGQKQRVSIARALADDPLLLIGDEMTSALDSHTAMEIMTLLREQIRGKRSALLVTHDHRLERFADRVVVMEDGRIDSDSGAAPARGQAS